MPRKCTAEKSSYNVPLPEEIKLFVKVYQAKNKISNIKLAVVSIIRKYKEIVETK